MNLWRRFDRVVRRSNLSIKGSFFAEGKQSDFMHVRVKGMPTRPSDGYFPQCPASSTTSRTVRSITLFPAENRANRLGSSCRQRSGHLRLSDALPSRSNFESEPNMIRCIDMKIVSIYLHLPHALMPSFFWSSPPCGSIRRQQSRWMKSTYRLFRAPSPSIPLTVNRHFSTHLRSRRCNHSDPAFRWRISILRRLASTYIEIPILSITKELLPLRRSAVFQPRERRQWWPSISLRTLVAVRATCTEPRLWTTSSFSRERSS